MAIREIVKPDTTSRRHPWRLVLMVGVAVVAAVGIALLRTGAHAPAHGAEEPPAVAFAEAD